MVTRTLGIFLVTGRPGSVPIYQHAPTHQCTHTCLICASQDVKFAINPQCKGSVQNIKIRNDTGTYGWPSSYCE